MNNFGETRTVVGRKDHRCIWCGGPIPKGESHNHFSGMWEGEWQNWRMHHECYEQSSDDDTLRDGFTPYEGEMPERVKQLVGAQ